MELIRDIHARKTAAGQPVVSFEFFPPKTDEGDRALLEKTLPALKALRPDYCSVTYGAGGGTREKTLMIVDRIQREHGLTTMCHLTCVNATAEELRGVLLEARRAGHQEHSGPARRSAGRQRPIHPRPRAVSSIPINWSNSSRRWAGFALARPVFRRATSPAGKDGRRTGTI